MKNWLEDVNLRINLARALRRGVLIRLAIVDTISNTFQFLFVDPFMGLFTSFEFRGSMVREDRLIKLGALGIFGGGSRELWESFKQLGLLHLLVMSGSQVEQYRKLLGAISGIGAKVLGLMPRLQYWIWLIVTALFYLGLGAYLKWDPPITRAILLGLLSFWPLKIRGPFKIVGVIVLQGILFPGHLFMVGFYLSWLCFLTLVFTAPLRNRFPLIMALALGFICQFFIVLYLPRWPTWLEFLGAGVSNAVVGLVYEKAFMPLVCTLVILGSLPLWGALPIVKEAVLGTFFWSARELSVLILGVVDGLGYTFRYGP